MNIFSTDKDPIKSAINLDDIRVNKMIIESAALLANAIKFHGGTDVDLPIAKTSGLPFKTKAWQNHPSCVWVKENKSNYMWLTNHMESLIDEMLYRKQTTHSMSDNLLKIKQGVKFLPDGELTNFANCTPYKQENNVVAAYRMTMAYKWEHDARKPVWTNRVAPDWYNHDLIELVKSTNGEFLWTGVRSSASERRNAAKNRS